MDINELMSKLSVEDKKVVFSHLYKEYEGENKPEEKMTKPKTIKEKVVKEKVVKEKKEPVPRKPVEIKSKKFIEGGLPEKIMVDYVDGMTQAKIAEKYELSTYMVKRMLDHGRANSKIVTTSVEEVVSA